MKSLKIRLNTLQQSQNNLDDRFVDRYEVPHKQRKQSLRETQIRSSKLKNSTQQSSIYEQLFRKQAIIRRIRHASFEKCSSEQISDFFITNHLQENPPKEKGTEKYMASLKPLFKIKKRKIYFKNILNRFRDEIQFTSSLKHKWLDQQIRRKSSLKGITETNFYKKFKSSISNKKQREKQKNTAENSFGNTTLRMQHIQMIKRYSLKTVKPSTLIEMKEK